MNGALYTNYIALPIALPIPICCVTVLRYYCASVLLCTSGPGERASRLPPVASAVGPWAVRVIESGMPAGGALVGKEKSND